MRYEDIFNTETLNIFVDASMDLENHIGCPGVVGVITLDDGTTKNIYYSSRILRNVTNNYSEANAIYDGVIYAINERNKFKYINIFSDSLICINSLNKWIFNWVNNIINDKLIGSSGEVANQEVFKRIINTMINANINIKFYHQKGHVHIFSSKSIINAANTFERSNNVNIEGDKALEFITTISKYNDIVDVNSGKDIEIFKANGFNEYISYNNPFINILNVKEIKKYKNLIGR